MRLERPAGGTAGDVHRAPHAAADDECRTELVRDVRRQQSRGSARCSPGCPRVAWSRLPTGTRRAARPAKVLTSSIDVLAADQQLTGRRRLIRREDPVPDQLGWVVAGHQTRVRVQVCQQLASLSMTLRSRGELGEELLARQPPGAERVDLVDEPVDRPVVGMPPVSPPRAARKIPVCGGWPSRRAWPPGLHVMPTHRLTPDRLRSSHGPAQASTSGSSAGSTTIKADGDATGGR